MPRNFKMKKWKIQKAKTNANNNEFDLEKARHEVFQLGIKGFSDKDKRLAKQELAIRLGAKPKKPRGKNIKQHLEAIRERKKQEQQEREQMRQQQLDDSILYSKKHSHEQLQRKKFKKKSLNEVRGMDYQLGKFRNGVQYLSREDIKKLKK